MAFNKKEHFSETDQNMADFAKALSHPARIAILRKLASVNMCICGEIVEVMPLAQSTVSQHLKELKSAGIVQGEIEGSASKYCINWDELEREFENFTKLLAEFKEHKKNIKCC
jgi:ArsR family transcriptional regulator